MLENNIELHNTGEYIQNIFKKLIQRYCSINSLNDTLFHEIACETNVGLKLSRLSLVKGKGVLSLVDVGEMGC